MKLFTRNMKTRHFIIILLAILTFGAAGNGAKAQTDDVRIRVLIDDQWKYIDQTGNYCLEKETAQYDNITEFTNGLAAVSKNDKWGFIDKSGKLVIPLQFDKVGEFADNGLAMAVKKDESQFGYINKEGNFVMEQLHWSYGNWKKYSDNGLAPCMNGKKLWGYMDEKGNVKIEPKYEKANLFYEGLAFVESHDETGYHDMYIDEKGNVAFSVKIPLWFDAGDFHNGLAYLKGSNDKYGYIDKTGKFVIEPQFDEAKNFVKCGDNVLAVVKKGKKWGFVTKDGNVRQMEFDKAHFTAEGILFVQVEGHLMMVTTDGKGIEVPHFEDVDRCTFFWW